ncbi:Leucine aminopeptidase 1 [Podochytrium sp. JEL0797]|nr:Leucine aminopeptidase 1 [Podochytrium sp. JEL0797]
MRVFLLATSLAALATALSPLPRGNKQHALVPQDASPSALAALGFRLISLSEGEAAWHSQADILRLYQTQTKFIDITDGDWERVAASLQSPKRFALPSNVAHQSTVAPLADAVSTKRMVQWLTKFTSFKTRYYQSPTGKESAEWLHDQLVSLAKAADPSVAITVTKFHHEWTQFSLILRIEPRAYPTPLPAVVISAHQDSTNAWNPWWGAAPGADDDGSGSCTIFEALKVIVDAGFVPHRPIEFHWYSAEEAGLLGSQKVVAHYKENNVPIYGVFHADMTGYTPKGKQEVIGMATDFVDPELESFVKKLVTVYNKGLKIVDTQCGYACSDHATWTQAGYPAAFTFETDFKESSPYIHSTNDVVENISFEHVEKFTRLAIAFAVEMSLAK